MSKEKWKENLEGIGGLEAFALIENPKRWEKVDPQKARKMKTALWSYWERLNPSSTTGGKKSKSQQRLDEIVDILGGEVIE